MTHTLNPLADLATDTDDVARLVTPDGERVADPDLERWVADVDTQTLRSLYRDRPRLPLGRLRLPELPRDRRELRPRCQARRLRDRVAR